MSFEESTDAPHYHRLQPDPFFRNNDGGNDHDGNGAGRIATPSIGLCRREGGNDFFLLA